MHAERESNLKLYSLGIVAVTKERGSDFIKVTPIEYITMTDGLLADHKSKYDVTTPDASGIKRTNQLEGDSMIVAKWIAHGQSNRMTAPDVVKSETVLIFRYADTDDYYWTTVFREPGLRRLETVNYGFCNLPDGLTPFDKETSYWLEVSTHDQYIHLHTSKNNGEPFAYDVLLDTGKGNLSITDNAGNRVVLDSPSSTATITTNSNVVLNTTVVTINASDSVNLNTPTTNISGNVNIQGVITGPRFEGPARYADSAGGCP